MTTTITQFTGGHDGSGGAPIDRITQSSIGGTASAGDWLQLITVGGAADSGLDVTVALDDVSGTTGWVIDFDIQTGSGADEIRVIGWRKLCVGGEQFVEVQWPGPAAHTMVGCWASNLSLPVMYLQNAGVAHSDPPYMRFQAASPPGLVTANSAVTVGVGFGGAGATEADFAPGTDCSTQGGIGTVLVGSGLTGAIAHYNNDEALTTTPTLIYQLKPEQVAVMYLYAFSDGTVADVDLEGTGDLLLGGEAELTIISGDPVVAGVGRLLIGGEAALEITGGDQTIAGTGHLLVGGSTVLTAPVPSPPIPERAIANVVGCGVYEVLAFTRGGGEVVGSLEFDNLAWGRKLDATSAATMTIDGVSNLGALERCCELIGSLNPWEHELALYRQVPGSQQKQRVWMGPITRMRFPNESVVIEALDLSGWLQRRTLHLNHNFVQVDLIDMWVAWVEDAMSVENSAGLVPHVLALSGILANRLTTIVEHDYAADAIAEIATTGIDWTVIDRVMQAGPILPQPDFAAVDALPLLLDEAFRVAPEIIVDGMAMGDCWFVNGGGAVAGVPIFGEYGPAFTSTPDHVAQPAAPDYAAIEAQFGRIEQVVSETRILDVPSIDKNAQTRYALTKLPTAYITGGELLPTAPIPMNQIVPGALLRVKLNRACKPIDEVMRIESLDVTANADGSESVDIGLEPIGTVSNG